MPKPPPLTLLSHFRRPHPHFHAAATLSSPFQFIFACSRFDGCLMLGGSSFLLLPSFPLTLACPSCQCSTLVAPDASTS